MTRRITHANQRSGRLSGNDTLFERVPSATDLPAPETAMLELSKEEFDALFGDQRGQGWEPTISDGSELTLDLAALTRR